MIRILTVTWELPHIPKYPAGCILRLSEARAADLLSTRSIAAVADPSPYSEPDPLYETLRDVHLPRGEVFGVALTEFMRALVTSGNLPWMRLVDNPSRSVADEIAASS